MNRRTLCARAATLGAGVILIAGCESGGSDFPTGQWSTKHRSGGVAVVDFRPDGTWELSQGPTKNKNRLTQVSTGLYSTTEEVVTFEADSRCEALHYGIEPGTYTWTLESEQLTMTPLVEPCVERRGDMGGLTFSRVVAATGSPVDASG